MNRFNRVKVKITTLTAVIILALALTGVSAGHWQEIIHIETTITTGNWFTPEDLAIEFSKTIDGVYLAGENPTCLPDNPPKVDDTLPLIYFNDANHNVRQWFKVTLTAANTGITDMVDVNIVDSFHFKEEVEFIVHEPSNIYIAEPEWGDSLSLINGLVEIKQAKKNTAVEWNIDVLEPGETESLIIWLGLTQQPSGKYHPTSESGDDLPMNLGLTATIHYEVDDEWFVSSAEIDPVTFITNSYGSTGDNLAILVLEGGDSFAFPYTLIVQPVIEDY